MEPPGNQEKGPESNPQEPAKGPESQTDKAATAKGASSTTLINTLRFSSFGARSAPSRLWSNRVEADDPEELDLPPVLLPSVGSPNVFLSQRVDSEVQDSQGTDGPIAIGGDDGQEALIPSPTSTIPGQLGEGCGQEASPALSPRSSPGQLGAGCGQEIRNSSTSSPRHDAGLGGSGSVEQVAPRSPAPTIVAEVARSVAPTPSSPTFRDGRPSGEH